MTSQTSLEEIFSHYSNYDLTGLEVIQGVPQKQFFLFSRSNYYRPSVIKGQGKTMKIQVIACFLLICAAVHYGKLSEK